MSSPSQRVSSSTIAWPPLEQLKQEFIGTSKFAELAQMAFDGSYKEVCCVYPGKRRPQKNTLGLRVVIHLAFEQESDQAEFRRLIDDTTQKILAVQNQDQLTGGQKKALRKPLLEEFNRSQEALWSRPLNIAGLCID